MNIVFTILSVLTGIISLLLIIRFVRPFAGIAHAKMKAESIAGDQTKVSWSTSSTMKYPMNIMLLMIMKMLEKDMDTSLSTLKNILEK